MKNEISDRIMGAEIESIECTCEACPSQFEIKLNDGRMVYARYRWGRLSIKMSDNDTEDIREAIGGEEIYSWDSDNDLDGSMTIFQLNEHLRECGFIC